MNTSSLKRGLAIVLSGYAKRWMESGVYDRLMNSELGQRLKDLDPKAKYGMEGMLYVLTAVLEQKFSEDTPLKALIKELGMDAGPEIAKRMVNGGEVAPNAAPASVHTPAEAGRGNAPMALLALEQDQLSSLLLWLSEIETERRKRLIVGLGRLPAVDLAKFVAMAEADRECFAQHFLGVDDEAAFKRVMAGAERARECVLGNLHETILKLRLGEDYDRIAQEHGNVASQERNAALYAALHGKIERESGERQARIDRESATSRRKIITLWTLLGLALAAMIFLNH